MDCEFEKIFINQIVTEKKDNFIVEDNIIIPDIKPDVLSIIRSSGNVYVYKKELINGKVKIDGGVKIDIIYLADNEQNNIRGIHTVLDFSKTVDLNDADSIDKFDCDIDIKDIEPKILNGRKINIQVNLELNFKGYSNKEKELVKSVNCLDDVQMISDSLKVNSLKGFGDTVSIAKDTISVDDNVADIFSTNISVKNKEIKISYNKVLSKANIVFEIMYLTEDEQVKKVTATVPIMGFIDIPGISENEICNTNYEIRNIDIKLNSVEDHSISVEVEFLIMCDAYEEREINIIQDLYSPEKDISLNQESADIIQNMANITDYCDIKEKINCSEIKDDKILDLCIKPRVLKQNILADSVSFECELDCTMLYESKSTNRLEEKSQKIDFTHVINSDKVSKDSIVNTRLEIENKDYVCTADNTIDLNVGVSIFSNLYVKNSVNIINNIDIKKYDDVSRSNSLVVYFVKNGDTLWKIAKKFRSTIDEIAKINGIENVDKIKVGEQLFIPRYVNV